MKRLINLVVIFIVLVAGSRAVQGNEKEKPRVRLGYLQNDLHQLACWVALEKGMFKEEGVEVEVEGVFKAGPEQMTAFAAGSLDIGYVGEAPATMAVANKTAQVIAIAQVNKEGSAIVVKKNSPIKSVTNLCGKTIAVPGYAQVQDLLLRKALRNQKVDEKQVNIIVLKPPEMISALSTSQIDAFIAWEPYPAKGVVMGAGEVLINSEEIWKDHPCCVLIADARFLKKNPEKVKRILRAHVRGTDFIHNHGEEAIKIAVKFTGMDEPTVRMAMKNIKFDYLPSIDGEIEYLSFLSELGYLNIKNPRDFTNHFINAKILQEVINQ